MKARPKSNVLTQQNWNVQVGHVFVKTREIRLKVLLKSPQQNFQFKKRFDFQSEKIIN